MHGMTIGRVLLFFSFWYEEVHYPCAFVNWLTLRGDQPDPDTGMWVVEPEYGPNGKTSAVVHLGSIARSVHLLPVYGNNRVPDDFHFSYSLDVYRAFFVNHYSDHHIHEFLK